jgi:hypothetical protein
MLCLPAFLLGQRQHRYELSGSAVPRDIRIERRIPCTEPLDKANRESSERDYSKRTMRLVPIAWQDATA